MISPRVKAALRWMLALLILAFLVYGLASRWDELRSGNIEFSWTFLAVCAAWNLAFFMMQAYVWRQCLSFLGHPINLAGAFYIWSVSQVSKYVPGKVMLILVRVGMAERESVPKTKTMISIYLELMLMILTSAAAALMFAPAAFASFEKFHFIVFGIVIVVGLATMHPKFLSRFINFGLRIVKKDEMEFFIPFKQMLICAALLFIGWQMHGLSAMAAVKAVGVDTVPTWPVLTGFFAFGWLIGFLSFLTPGGLGVREGALAALLSAFYPLEIAIAISLISRVAWIMAEVIMAGIFWFIGSKAATEAA